MMKKAHLIFTIILGALFTFGTVMALSFAQGARIYPLVVGSLGILLCVVEVTRGSRKGLYAASDGPDDNSSTEERNDSVTRRAVLRMLGWVVGLYVAIFLVGFRFASLLFIVGFLHIEARTKKTFSIGGAITVFVLLTLLGRFLNVEWPAGLLGV